MPVFCAVDQCFVALKDPVNGRFLCRWHEKRVPPEMRNEPRWRVIEYVNQVVREVRNGNRNE